MPLPAYRFDVREVSQRVIWPRAQAKVAKCSVTIRPCVVCCNTYLHPCLLTCTQVSATTLDDVWYPLIKKKGQNKRPVAAQAAVSSDLSARYRIVPRATQADQASEASKHPSRPPLFLRACLSPAMLFSCFSAPHVCFMYICCSFSSALKSCLQRVSPATLVAWARTSL